MDDKIPASFEEAKELARRQMLAEAQARSSEDDATPSQPPIPDADAEDAPDEAADPQVAESDDEPEDDADDDEADEEGDEPTPDADTSDDEPDDEPEPDDRPEPKRKASRRSKRVSRLEQQNKDLEAKLASFEAEREQSEERILERLQQEQARRAALEAEQKQREADDRAIEAEMHEYLGSDEEYQAAIAAALQGDVLAQERAREWHDRRQQFTKLNRRAEARVNAKAAQIFWDSTSDLPGVDREILQKADFGTVLQHLHAAGIASEQGRQAKELEKRDAQIARLQGELKQLKVAKVPQAARRSDPLEGGTPIPTRATQDPYAEMLNPDGSINREKFEAFKLKQRRDALG